MKESLHMLSMARRQGITDVFATSHYSKAFPNRDPEKLRRLRDELMSRANRPVKGPDGKIKRRQPIRIWTGQEIFYSNKKVPKTVMINNWIDENEIYPLDENNEKVLAFKKKYGLDGKFVIMYSGNIGLYYDLENLMKVVERIKPGTKTVDGREVVFAFVGAGSVLDKCDCEL